MFCLFGTVTFIATASWVWPERLCWWVSVLNLGYPERTHWSWVCSHCFSERLWCQTLLFGLPYSSMLRFCKAVLWDAGLLKVVEKVWDGGSGSSSWNAALERACAKCLEVWNLRFWPIVPGCSWTESTQVCVSGDEDLWCNSCFGRACFWKEKGNRSRFLITVLPHDNALFVSVLLFRSSPGQVSIQKGGTGVLQSGKCTLKYMCIYTVYAHKDTYSRNPFLPQF